MEARQEVNANTPVFEVVDPTTVEVDGIVDEIDVLFIREGAPARVTMDALPDQVLEGTVSAISAAAQNQQGVVSYPIRVRVTQQGAQLPEGLSAVASVVIREELNVLLVPLQALYGTFEQPIVRVMKDGRIEERPVVLGNTDDFWAAVREVWRRGTWWSCSPSRPPPVGSASADSREGSAASGPGQCHGTPPGGGFGGGSVDRQRR